MFTDDELLAYAEERLASDRSSAIELVLRNDAKVVARLSELLSRRDHGEHTIGQVWRRGRLSCPPRAVWSAFVEGRLGDGLSQYLRFHVQTIGCRICAANLNDLERPGTAAEAERRARKIFQSSAGKVIRR